MGKLEVPNQRNIICTACHQRFPNMDAWNRHRLIIPDEHMSYFDEHTRTCIKLDFLSEYILREAKAVMEETREKVCVSA